MNLFSTISKGAVGEDYTVKYLKKHMFRITERNMRNKYSEIDIIAEDKQYIIFVEVKTRTGEGDLRPIYAVDKRKQQKILKAAHYYLTQHQSNKQPRFDVAEVFLDEKSHKPYKINYIENAYTQGGEYAVF